MNIKFIGITMLTSLIVFSIFTKVFASEVIVAQNVIKLDRISLNEFLNQRNIDAHKLTTIIETFESMNLCNAVVYTQVSSSVIRTNRTTVLSEKSQSCTSPTTESGTSPTSEASKDDNEDDLEGVILTFKINRPKNCTLRKCPTYNYEMDRTPSLRLISNYTIGEVTVENQIGDCITPIPIQHTESVVGNTTLVKIDAGKYTLSPLSHENRNIIVTVPLTFPLTEGRTGTINLNMEVTIDDSSQYENSWFEHAPSAAVNIWKSESDLLFPIGWNPVYGNSHFDWNITFPLEEFPKKVNIRASLTLHAQ